MREQQLLRLARIDVGAAGAVHVGGAPGDVEKAALVEAAEVAGVEPALLQRLGIGLRLIVVAGADGSDAPADSALLSSRHPPAIVVLACDPPSPARTPPR